MDPTATEISARRGQLYWASRTPPSKTANPVVHASDLLGLGPADTIIWHDPPFETTLQRFPVQTSLLVASDLDTHQTARTRGWRSVWAHGLDPALVARCHARGGVVAFNASTWIPETGAVWTTCKTRLTPGQQRVMLALWRAGGTPCSREALQRPGASPRSTDAVISTLRAQLGADAIRTVRGVGWALVEAYRPPAVGLPERTGTPIGSGMLDAQGMTLWLGDEAVALSANETRVLQLLGPGRVVGRAAIEHALWGHSVRGNRLDTLLYRLRARLPPGWIRAVRGQGFVVPTIAHTPLPTEIGTWMRRIPRPVAVVVGPPASGKTGTARAIATHHGMKWVDGRGLSVPQLTRILAREVPMAIGGWTDAAAIEALLGHRTQPTVITSLTTPTTLPVVAPRTDWGLEPLAMRALPPQIAALLARAQASQRADTLLDAADRDALERFRLWEDGRIHPAAPSGPDQSVWHARKACAASKTSRHRGPWTRGRGEALYDELQRALGAALPEALLEEVALEHAHQAFALGRRLGVQELLERCPPSAERARLAALHGADPRLSLDLLEQALETADPDARRELQLIRVSAIATLRGEDAARDAVEPLIADADASASDRFRLHVRSLVARAERDPSDARERFLDILADLERSAWDTRSDCHATSLETQVLKLDTLRHLSTACIGVGSPDAAIEILRRAVATGGPSRPVGICLMNLANLLIGAGAFEEARQVAEDASAMLSDWRSDESYLLGLRAQIELALLDVEAFRATVRALRTTAEDDPFVVAPYTALLRCLDGDPLDDLWPVLALDPTSKAALQAVRTRNWVELETLLPVVIPNLRRAATSIRTILTNPNNT